MPEEANLQVFRECLSEAINASPHASEDTRQKRSRARKNRSRKQPIERGDETTSVAISDTTEDMLEFVEYLATEIFSTLPGEIQTLSYSEKAASTLDLEAISNSDSIEKLVSSMPVAVSDSLSAYDLMDIGALLTAVLPSYIDSVTAAPPVWSSTRPEACELCERDWISLTYHHLIPRSQHDKAVKRGWHEEWELNKVAWLCGACHRYVHRVASNEDLARHWDTVEKLQSREDVQKFVQWVGGIRWKKR